MFVLALGVVLAIVCPIGTEKPFDKAAFDGVLNQIRNGQLRADARGVILLPGPLRHLTATGRVYVTRSDSKGLSVFFPSWVGRQTLLELVPSNDNWVEGYQYDSAMKWGGPLKVPGSSPPWNAQDDDEVGENCLNEDDHITDGWSHVSPFS